MIVLHLLMCSVLKTIVSYILFEFLITSYIKISLIPITPTWSEMSVKSLVFYPVYTLIFFLHFAHFESFFSHCLIPIWKSRFLEISQIVQRLN